MQKHTDHSFSTSARTAHKPPSHIAIFAGVTQISLGLLAATLIAGLGVILYLNAQAPMQLSPIMMPTTLLIGMLLFWQIRKIRTRNILEELLIHWKSALHLPGMAQNRPRSFQALYGELRLLTDNAIENHRMQMQLKMQLESQSHKLSEYEKNAPLKDELKGMFTRVHGYAKMLEENIARNHADPSLRDEFDELSEHCVNLQLLTRGMELLQNGRIFAPMGGYINPASAMSGMLLALSTALERRNMSLSTLRWNEHATARIDSALLELILWLTLLGAVRYAEEESTLSLSCESAADGSGTYITCLITELAPATMLAEERLAYMLEKSKYQNAHMFAHTLASNTNYMLASQLIERTGGTLNVHPRTQNSCLVELILPA
jgi:hypothetical protein